MTTGVEELLKRSAITVVDEQKKTLQVVGSVGREEGKEQRK